MKITIFRIIQECMNNIIKHSKATHVNIYLQYREKDVRINVRDNGVGFDPSAVNMEHSNRPSLGLAGMEERAALLGGTVSVQSRPGYGTEIEALIPYQYQVNMESDDKPSNSKNDSKLSESKTR
jgi:signal transduction histidine kinase